MLFLSASLLEDVIADSCSSAPGVLLKISVLPVIVCRFKNKLPGVINCSRRRMVNEAPHYAYASLKSTFLEEDTNSGDRIYSELCT